MAKVSHRAVLLQPLLAATALPLVLPLSRTVEGAMSKSNLYQWLRRLLVGAAAPFCLLAANPTPGVAFPGQQGAAGSDATATATTKMFPSNLSNTATAIGGPGGAGATVSDTAPC
jgi:hypothetical protein